MSVKEEHICRLCLKVANDEFQIDENIKQIFEILLLKLDLGLTGNPVICQDCMEVSKKCLNFKYTCIDTEEFILSYSADRKKVKLDIKVIYEEKECVRIVFDEDFDICRLCVTRLERNNFTSLDALMNESMFEMLSKYMAEMDFNRIENPLVCANCKESLDDYFKFVLNCQDVEEKIKAYGKEKGTDSLGQVTLSNVLLFTFTRILEYPDKPSQTYKIEQEHTEGVYPEPHIELIKHEEMDIKDEEMTEIDLYKNGDTFPPKEYDKVTKSDMISLNSGEHNSEWLTYKKNIQGNIRENCLFDGGSLELKRNGICDIKIHEPATFVDETQQKEHTVKGDCVNNSDALKANMNEHKLYTSEAKQRCVSKNHASTCKVTLQPKQKQKITKHMSILKDAPELHSYISVDRNICPMYKCSLCTYEAKKKGNLKIHMLVHTEVSEIRMYKCPLCTYAAKEKGNLKIHMLVHKDVSEIKMFKCSLCTYETKHKCGLNSHMLVHKDVSEIKMFKCSLCTYETKRKGNLKIHMLVHKDVSEIKMFKCSLCTYETKHKRGLNSHMLVHKDVSEIKMFKCSLCTYETKRKCSLKRHNMVVHNDLSEIRIYKCSLCTYKAGLKHKLKIHMLVHKDVSEIQMFKCSLCAYETKHKRRLTLHMLVHKDVSAIKMYKCSFCTYEAKRKGDLTYHSLIHKDASEIIMYKCSLCTYEGKHKRSLNLHMLVHKDVSEIKMYKCSSCTYETKNRSHLTTHMLLHKNVSEIKMFKCSLCAYETRRKGNLTSHILVHKDISEIKMYKCTLCAYEGKQKSNLTKHMLVHKNVSEIEMYKCSVCAYEAKCKSYLKRHILKHLKLDITQSQSCMEGYNLSP